MPSGFQGEFTLGDETSNTGTIENVVVQFDYKVKFTSGFDDTDIAKVLVSVNGGVSTVVETVTSNTEMTSYQSEWKTASAAIGTLSRIDTHTLQIGGYLSADQTTTKGGAILKIRFDNVIISGTG